MISKCRFFSEFKARRDRSNGIIAGGLPSLPVTAVRWSPVMVPMEPATLTIFVEARSEERVVTTWLRAIGSCTSPRLKNGWRARSEEHTSELQSRLHLVCRLLLEKKNNTSDHD